MSFLLDTCVISEFLKKQPDRKVVAWVGSQLEESLFLSVLTIGEVRKGIVKLKPSKRRTELDEWLEKVVVRYDGRVLPITLSIADRWGEIKGAAEMAGRTPSVIDSLIAATALEHELVVVTRNADDFTPLNVSVLNIWS